MRTWSVKSPLAQSRMVVHEHVRAGIHALYAAGKVRVDVGRHFLNLGTPGLRIGVAVNQLDDVRVVAPGVATHQEVDLLAREHAQFAAVADDLHLRPHHHAGSSPASASAQEHRALGLIAIRIGFGQQFGRTGLARQPPMRYSTWGLGTHEDVLARHLQVVLAQVDQHPLELIAVLADRPPRCSSTITFVTRGSISVSKIWRSTWR